MKLSALGTDNSCINGYTIIIITLGIIDSTGMEACMPVPAKKLKSWLPLLETG